MNALTTYTFPQTQTTIRMVTIDGGLWFVAADVCRVFGRSYDVSMAISKLGVGEKQTRKLSEFGAISDMEAKGPGGFRANTAMILISESGLYKLVMRSNKPLARPFQDWVTKDVLPIIRKDGMYVMGEEKVATGEMNEEELILKAYGLLQAKVERLKAGKEAAEAKALEAKTEELVEENQTICINTI
jgi:prophage antirepressor-like protein